MVAALLAVAIGGTILTGLATIYYDIPKQMGQEFRSYGANFVIIPAGNEQTMPLEAARKAVALLPESGITGIAPYRYLMAKVNEQPFMAAGTDLAGARKTSPYWLVQGRWPETAGEALIGQEVASRIRLVPGSDFFISGTLAGGGRISGSVEGQPFRVSGIVQTGGTEEAFIFMSLEDFEAMTGEGGRADVVECSVTVPRESLRAIAERINDSGLGVEAHLVRRVTESEGAVLTKLQALVYLVTIIVLLLTMICVATTMMAVVAERRKEIGLRKALGASNSSLSAEFLGEAVFLGGLGGLFGAILGFGFARAVGFQVFNRAVTLQATFLPLSILVSVAIAGIACIIPVRSATNVDPAIVLRGE
jgi:putative ABC transport system permease protein